MATDLRPAATVTAIVLCLLMPLTAAAAPPDSTVTAPGPQPSLRWLVEGPTGAAVEAAGLVTREQDDTLALRRVEDGTVERGFDAACYGAGPTTGDLGIRVVEDVDGAFVGLLLDVHSGFSGQIASPIGTLELPDEATGISACRIFPGYGDLALITVDYVAPDVPEARTKLFGVQVGVGANEVLWEDELTTCGSGLLPFDEPDPQVSDGIIVRLTGDCTEDGFALTAQDLRTGEIVAQQAVGAGPPDVVEPMSGAFAAAATGQNVTTVYDLVPTSAGVQWVARWTRELDQFGVVGSTAAVIVFTDSAGITAVRADDGTTIYQAFATAAAVDRSGSVVMVSGNSLLAVLADGTPVWEVADLGAELGGFLAFPQVVLGPDGGVYLLGQIDGERVLARLDSSAPEPARVLRIDDGDDPIDMAVRLCRQVVPTYQSASRVLIARSDVFADALAGAALAGQDGCILYVDGGPDAQLDRRTLYEVARVLPAGGRVYLLGGGNAVSATVEADLRATGYDVQRMAGDTRIETASLIGREVAAITGNPDQIAYVATAGNFPDAVTAGAHAAFEGIPVLLSDREALSEVTAQTLTDLGITSTVLLGGTAALSDAVLAAVPGGTRVAGETRFGTAAEVSRILWADSAAQNAVVVAIDTEDSWQAALAAAPLSAQFAAPQIGVAAALAPQESIAAYAAIGQFPSTFAIGTNAVVPSEVLRQLMGGFSAAE